MQFIQQRFYLTGFGASILGMMLSWGRLLPMQAIPSPLTTIDTPAPQPTVDVIARTTTVRIWTTNAAGSGVIIKRQGEVYTVLTNWHVVEGNHRLSITTFDGQRYSVLAQRLKPLGRLDLAIIQFRSRRPHQVAVLNPNPVIPGETVYAAGFPLYSWEARTTLDQGIKNFRLTQGQVSLLLPKSMPQGYQLGYTNEVVVGMSGGPIFNAMGKLVGINGRVKDRDPGFGSYVFEDGSEPNSSLLAQMVDSSWGIPITTYLHFIPLYLWSESS